MNRRKRVNIYDIAKLADVSIATVSRVVNNSPKVSARTKEKVLAIMKENEYTPNAFARGLGLGTMKTVGIICPDISDIYMAKAVSYLESNLHDHGYDCINNYAPSAQTADFLNSLIASNELPKTILYSLNPNDNEAIGTILGCFQGTEAAGKIQQGSAWWFNDHKTGMIAQMTSLANLGLLSNFVGMLTDSRSFLSYTRHEYFRRILCELIGGWVENGEYPADYKTLKEIVCGIAYNNAVNYFGFDL